MGNVISKDGTTIAYSQKGQGQPVILVDGALCYRAFGPAEPLAEMLAPNFNVFTYDRRGRGESSDTTPYAVEREIEDLEALIKEAGGSAYVYGISSGAALSLEAANYGLPIQKLALYEAPYIVDHSRSPYPGDYVAQLKTMIAANRPGDAVKSFMKLVGTPRFFIFMMQFMPVWSKLKAVGHTLPYDITIIGENGRGNPFPAHQWDSVTIPTIVMDGGKSPDWMRNAMKSLANVLPNAKYRTLAGQTHMLKPEAVTPELVSFFCGEGG